MHMKNSCVYVHCSMAVVDGIFAAAGDGRLEDVKKCIQNGVDINRTAGYMVGILLKYMIIIDQVATKNCDVKMSIYIYIYI